MKPEIDPLVVAAFGSETRVRLLAVLAGASRPLTAYRVGKTGGVPLPNAYREIGRLEKDRLVRRVGDGIVLVDRDVRDLLRKRVRIAWWEDWLSLQGNRIRRAQQVADGRGSWFDPARYAPDPKATARTVARYAKEFERPPEKDAILGRIGGRKSLKRSRR